MIHWVGWKYKWFRKLYYKLTGRWLWGIVGWLSTYSVNGDIPPYSYEEFKEHLEEIFRY